VRHLDQDVPLHVTGAIASIVHLAYHLGAIRQVNHAAAGPQAVSGS
jgi:DMSO reductase anchor subunit